MQEHAGSTIRLCRAAGLHRVGTAPAIWVDDAGDRVRDPAVLARLAALAVPPGWRAVWASTDPEARVQATGIDARGRTQYRYSSQAVADADRDKFHHMLAFAEALPHLRGQVAAHLTTHGPATEAAAVKRATAAAVRLLDKGLIRVGNDRYARDNHTYGLTTLTKEHVAIDGSAIEFTFVGKEHRPWHVVVDDEQAARVLVELQDDATTTEPVFGVTTATGRHTITSAVVNAYIHGLTSSTSTAKTFRTWGGSAIAAAVAAGADASWVPRSRRPDLAPLDVAAAMLGNTRTVAKRSYVHPRAIEAGRTAAVAATLDAAARAARTRDIRAVLGDDALVRSITAQIAALT
jgi:DNA topoisomerase-1